MKLPRDMLHGLASLTRAVALVALLATAPRLTAQSEPQQDVSKSATSSDEAADYFPEYALHGAGRFLIATSWVRRASRACSASCTTRVLSPTDSAGWQGIPGVSWGSVCLSTQTEAPKSRIFREAFRRLNLKSTNRKSASLLQAPRNFCNMLLLTSGQCLP